MGNAGVVNQHCLWNRPVLWVDEAVVVLNLQNHNVLGANLVPGWEL